MLPLSLALLGLSFRSLLPSLPSHAEASLSDRGILSPTPIQAAALRLLASGESVVLHAPTGSGKSLAFLLPALSRGVGPRSKMMLLAPTRELAVQLAAEADALLGGEASVAIVAVGSRPSAAEMIDASVLACTAPEMLELLGEAGVLASAADAALASLAVIVLDEIDSLLPSESFRGPRALAMRKAANKRADEPAAQTLLLRALELCAEPELQLIAASATVSRPSRAKLARILRRDPLGRWFERPLAVVRPAELEAADLSKMARAVTVPASIRHTYVRLPMRVAKLAHVGSVAHARRTGASAAQAEAELQMRAGHKPTLKEKRRLKAAKSAAAAAAAAEARTHPLIVALGCAVSEQQPRSALVFLCRSSGLTVRKAARQMRAIGLPVKALHEAIGLEHAPPGLHNVRKAGTRTVRKAEPVEWWNKPEYRDEDASVVLGDGSDEEDWEEAELATSPGGRSSSSTQLQSRQRELAAQFRACAGLRAAESERAEPPVEPPFVVTFEDMARGLHFDGVEVVYILGLPDSPATYLHLAGRTGREPVLSGTVLTICPGNSHAQLCAWANRLGDVHFEEVELEGLQQALSNR